MSKTKIQYGDRTWNVLTGCTIKSEGCVNCWARKMAKRLRAMGRPEYQNAVNDAGNWTGKITLVPERLNEPLTWRKPQHVLVEYMGDLFHENVDANYVYKVFDVMKKTPQHTYQTLTKRPSNMEFLLLNQEPLPNVILGVSVENQMRADQRFGFMRILAERGWRTWASYEPALGKIDWSGWEFLNQLICGGESGVNARPMHPDWARCARDFCQTNGIPFFFKQWGEYAPLDHLAWVTDKTTFSHKPVDLDGVIMCRVGKARAGHVLDGREWLEFPK
jgi:protein gp37